MPATMSLKSSLARGFAGLLTAALVAAAVSLGSLAVPSAPDRACSMFSPRTVSMR